MTLNLHAYLGPSGGSEMAYLLNLNKKKPMIGKVIPLPTSQVLRVKFLSRVQLLATPWTIAYWAPPSMGFSRQEYWSGVPLPSLHRKLVNLITRTTALSNSMKLSHAMWDHPRWAGHGGEI